MKSKAISRDVALNVLTHLKSSGAEGPFDRGDITVGLEDLSMRSSDENIDAVLAAQEVAQSGRSVEEGAARLSA